jgi:hypothetical protein
VDPLRPVHKGDNWMGRLRDADALSSVFAAARQARGQTAARTGGGSGRGTVSPNSTVWMRAHADLPRGSIVSVGGVVAWDPAASDGAEFDAARAPGFLAADPVAGAPFLVTLEPAKGPVGDALGDVVRAAAAGVALVWLSTPGGTVHDFADVIDGDPTQMLSAESGPAQVLWSEADPADVDERWAAVLIGSQAAGVATPAASWATPSPVITRASYRANAIANYANHGRGTATYSGGYAVAINCWDIDVPPSQATVVVSGTVTLSGSTWLFSGTTTVTDSSGAFINTHTNVAATNAFGAPWWLVWSMSASGGVAGTVPGVVLIELGGIRPIKTYEVVPARASLSDNVSYSIDGAHYSRIQFVGTQPLLTTVGSEVLRVDLTEAAAAAAIDGGTW